LINRQSYQPPEIPNFTGNLMKRNRTIQLKAAFLLLIFTLHTVIGYTCAADINFGLAATDFQNETPAEFSDYVQSYDHLHSALNDDRKQENDLSQQAAKSDCFKNKAARYKSLDKINVRHAHVIVNNQRLAILTSFRTIDYFNKAQKFHQKYKILSFHLPPPDIRVLISSFQI